MIIRYNNGQAFEAALLSRTQDSMRIALKGTDDVVELKQIHGVWVSEDCEPVRVDFEWQQQRPVEAVTEADCICSHDLAARLIHLLVSAEDQAPTAVPGARRTTVVPAYQHVI